VTFDPNGGSGSMASQTSATSAALTINSFSRIGFTLLGWSTDSTAATAQYANQANYPFTTNETLYAIWTPETFTINVTSTGPGTVTSSNPVVNFGESVTLTFTPSANASIASIIINGNSIPKVNSYTFTNVTNNQSIALSFQYETYTLIHDSNGATS
jgi:hypothetical protein